MKTTYNNVCRKMIKNQIFRYIHVFTDNLDEVINESSYSDAVKSAHKIKDDWIKRGFKNIRIYAIHEELDHRDGSIYQVSEDCIYSLGNYPN